LIRTLDHDQLDPARPLGEPLVGDGGEVERSDDDPAALAIVQRLRHGGERNGDARAEGDLLGRRGDHARVATAQLRQRGPPHVVPGGRPALLPEIEELGDAPASPLPERAQRAGIEVDLVPEDRELTPLVGERMGDGLDGHRVRRRSGRAAARGRGAVRALATGSDAPMNPVRNSVAVKRRGEALGFDAIGVASLERNAHADALDRWLAAGYAGTMSYLHRQ